MRTLTIDQLIEANACVKQVKLFKKCFKESVVVTEELAVTLAGKFDVDWASRNLLSSAARAEYKEVHADVIIEYEKICTVAFAEYAKVREVAADEFYINRTKSAGAAVAGAKYDKVRGAAFKRYEKVRDAAMIGCKKMCAVTFAKLYNADQT